MVSKRLILRSCQRKRFFRGNKKWPFWLPVALHFAAYFSGMQIVRAGTPSLEYQVKASFIYNFIKFVKWPEKTFANDRNQLVIGIVGENRFGVALEQLQGEKLLGREIQVRQFKNYNVENSCHVLFISSSEKNWRQILDALKGRPVFSIGETEGFARTGGVVNFVRQGNKIRFEINLKTAKQSGLEISSQLLSLAVNLFKDDGPG